MAAQESQNVASRQYGYSSCRHARRGPENRQLPGSFLSRRGAIRRLYTIAFRRPTPFFKIRPTPALVSIEIDGLSTLEPIPKMAVGPGEITLYGHEPALRPEKKASLIFTSLSHPSAARTRRKLVKSELRSHSAWPCPLDYKASTEITPPALLAAFGASPDKLLPNGQWPRQSPRPGSRIIAMSNQILAHPPHRH